MVLYPVKFTHLKCQIKLEKHQLLICDGRLQEITWTNLVT